MNEHPQPKHPHRAVRKWTATSTRPDDGNAFLPDPADGGPARVVDDLAEVLAEEFVQAATSAEEVSEDVRDEFVSEEIGGPFLEERIPQSKKRVDRA
jgi:hypothetical protein